MSPLQQEILSLTNQMDLRQQQHLLCIARQMTQTLPVYTGQELMAMSAEERERIVAHARAVKAMTDLLSDLDGEAAPSQTLEMISERV